MFRLRVISFLRPRPVVAGLGTPSVGGLREREERGGGHALCLLSLSVSLGLFYGLFEAIILFILLTVILLC